jgi:protein TonB
VSAGRLSLGLDPAGAEVQFFFETRQQRLSGALGVSVLAHALAVVLWIVVASRLPQRSSSPPLVELRNPDRLVWLPVEGPGGGGGGGGNQSQEPPRRAELPGRARVTVPVSQPPQPAPREAEEKPQTPDLNIPAKTLAAGEQVLPGTLEGLSTAALGSQGSGTGGGAGTGEGTGIGPGRGSGLGPGEGGGTGGGVYRPGSGVTLPRPIKEVKPQYTADAMRAKIQGSVWLEAVVLPDGTVGEVTIIKSLDPVFGLDEEAVKAAKQWRFIPGTRYGQPVPVLVVIELTFTLR